VTDRTPAPATTSPIATSPTATSPTAPVPARDRAPLVFGGIPESEGWALAPITPRDRVHFRVDRDLPIEEFRAALPEGVTVSHDYGEGLFRVDGAPGTAAVLADWVRAWCAGQRSMS